MMRNNNTQTKAIYMLLALVGCFVTFMAMIFNQQDDRPLRNHLKGRNMDISMLKQTDGKPFALSDVALVHIHLDDCASCKEDKKLFAKLRLNHMVEVVGIKWIESKTLGGDHEYDKVYTRLAHATNTDFFVKLGMATAPVTLVVGSDGKILYSHVGMLNEEMVYHDIITAIPRK